MYCVLEVNEMIWPAVIGGAFGLAGSLVGGGSKGGGSSAVVVDPRPYYPAGMLERLESMTNQNWPQAVNIQYGGQTWSRPLPFVPELINNYAKLTRPIVAGVSPVNNSPSPLSSFLSTAGQLIGGGNFLPFQQSTIQQPAFIGAGTVAGLSNYGL